MIAFLPIARYRVEYQVASGRPFSSFERLLLTAVKDGHSSVDALSVVFAVHRRLIVEALVTLMQAGWVLIGTGEKSFVLSPSGIVASQGTTLPPTIALTDRSTTIIVEKVTGQVARSNEIDFQPRKHLRALWDGGVELRKGDITNIVDPAQVSPLLAHQPTEWIRWIGPITVVSDNAAFAVIDVDTTTGRLVGLPSRWTAMLSPECLREARKREADLVASGALVPDDIFRELQQFVQADSIGSPSNMDSDLDVSWSPLTVNSDDIIRSIAAHKSALVAAIQNAQTYVAIAFPYLDSAVVTELMPLMTSGINRGLVFNVFLGKMPANSQEESGTALAALKKLEYDSTHGSYAGRLNLGTRATACNTYMVFADGKCDATAIIGAYPLSTSPALEGMNSISLRLKDPWVIARVCEIMDGFSSADEKLRLEAGFVRLRKAAGDLRELVSIGLTDNGSATEFAGQILLQKDHQKAITSAVSEAKHSVCIISDDLVGVSRCGWLNLLLQPAERLGPMVQLTYDASIDLDVQTISELEALIKMGIRLTRISALRGTLIVVDDDIAILTNSRLNAGSARNSYSSKIGIAVRGKGVWTRLFGLADGNEDL